jgi:predicted CxxxxCH...CXXCH cytochrome family protein
MDRSHRARRILGAVSGAAAALVVVRAGADVGTHPLHLRDTLVRSALACLECHLCPGPAPAWGSLAAARGATPSWNAAERTCSGVYCHGATMRSTPAQPPLWEDVSPDYTRPPAESCTTCHGWPPPLPHPQMVACHGCHSSTVLSNGGIDVAGGHHVDGRLDFAGGAGVGCAGCHGFPPATGAHVAHLGLAGEADTGQYGDTSILQDRFPAASPTDAPAVYAFGCGNCHPLDPSKHIDATLQVELNDGFAPAGTLKARASASAAFDPATGTCSGVYCHSNGQENPGFLVTPAWTSQTKLGCDACHDNPPRYASGGAGAMDANTHVVLGDDGWESGHFLGIPGPWHGSKHGGTWGAGDDSAPITCQSCHYDTTDPSNTGPSGFYYLDTSGAYRLPGGDASRLTTTWYAQLRCSGCHASGGASPAGSGKVRPLRHVNGSRDVVFDARSTLPDIEWLPQGLDRPSLPYWATNWNATAPADAIWNGRTVSFSLGVAGYDRPSKTCSNVACHMGQTQVQWGVTPVGWATCDSCHQYSY